MFLVGPMGVGKTTIGKLLAEELSNNFIDSDREIEARTGADIPWIFDVEGEEGFRQREARILQELCELDKIVLATGGGIVLREENRRALSSSGFVVYLTASLDLLVERTSKDKKRPLLQQGNPRDVLRTTLEKRDGLYREIADMVISTDRENPRQITEEIVKAFRNQVSA